MDSNLLSDWLTYINSNRPDEGEFGLDRLQSIFSKIIKQSLGKKTILVAGTNGKGTTVEYLKNFLLEAGYSTGTYTSPHLIQFNERIQINGNHVDDTRIVNAFKKIEKLKKDTRLTYFDYVTLAAFDIFASEELDFVIMEIGIGGKYDPVNLINSDISIITNIEMDHEKWLGKTREEIGSQKAAILKEGKIGILASECMPESVTSLAYKVCSSVFELGKSFTIEESLSGWNYTLKGNEFDLENLSYRNLNVESAAGAITAFKLISKKEIDYRGVIAKTFLKGRCDVVNNFIFDVSHNPASVKYLVNFLKKNYEHQNFNAIFSSMSNKDNRSIIKEISDWISEWNVCSIDDGRFNSSELEASINDLTGKKVKKFESVYSAIKSGYHKDDLYVVFGSFLTVSEGYKAIQEIRGEHSEKN